MYIIKYKKTFNFSLKLEHYSLLTILTALRSFDRLFSTQSNFYYVKKENISQIQTKFFSISSSLKKLSHVKHILNSFCLLK